MTPRPFALAASKSRPPSKNLLEIEDFLLIVQNGPGFAVPSYGFVPSGNGRFPHSSPQSQPTPVLEQLRDRRHARGGRPEMGRGSRGVAVWVGRRTKRTARITPGAGWRHPSQNNW